MPLEPVPVTFGSPHARVTDVEGFRVSDIRFEAGLDLPRHTHDRATVAVLLRGSMVQRGDAGRVRECRAATVLVEPAGEPHRNQFAPVGARVLTVQPDPADRDLLRPFLPLLSGGAQLHDPGLAALATRVTQEMRTPDDLTPLSVSGLVLELLARAARLAAPRPGRRPPSWLPMVRDLLHDRFSEPLRVSDLAAVAGVHPVHLSRAFRAEYGLPVTAYLRALRVDWAARRLETTNDSIADIADRAGFADQSHLTRAMRARYGMTPMERRRNAHSS
jgi:AraC family transcriptional regulator